MQENRLDKDTETVQRGWVYCASCEQYLAPGDAFDCPHGVPFGKPA